jgi:hypothetical protein
MAPPDDKPKRRGYWVPGFIALAALVIIGLLFGAGDLSHPAYTSINGPDIEQQISEAMQAEQNSANPPDVSCPRREQVKLGLAFDCTARTPSGQQVVHVTEIDNRGEIRWSLSPPPTTPTT